MAVYNLAFAIVLLPLAGALLSFMAETPRRIGQVCVTAGGFAAVIAIFLLGWNLGHRGDAALDSLYSFWSFVPGGGANAVLADPHLDRFQPQFGMHIDSLALVFMAVITVVGWTAQWHMLRALRGDAGLKRALWASSALVTSVLGIAVSPNLFQSLLLLGAGSVLAWLLINHQWDDAAAADGARDSLIVRHLGDASLLLATVFLYAKFGGDALQQVSPHGQTFNDPFAFSTISGEVSRSVAGAVPGVGMRTVVVLGVLLAVAVLVRCAQFPFDTWLSTSEGAPLTLLALVVALVPLSGALLLARVYPLFLAVPALLGTVAVVGAVTGVIAAVGALAHRDIGRVALTVSVSQMGLVVVAFGLGGFSNPLQMVAEYATFTVVLFIAAHNVAQNYRTRDIFEMGGAWRRMRRTAALLGLWGLAVGGMNLVSYQALAAVLRNLSPTGERLGTPVAVVAGAGCVATAVLVTAAAVRLWVRVCWGEPVKRRGFIAERLSEVDAPMWRSGVIAAVGGVVVIALGIPAVGATFSHFVFYGARRQELSVVTAAVVLAVACAALGGVLGLVVARKQQADGRATNLSLWFGGASLRVRARVVMACGVVAHMAGAIVSRLDADFTDPLGSAVADGYGLVERAIQSARTRRLPLYLAFACALGAVIVIAAGLYSFGHSPVSR